MNIEFDDLSRGLVINTIQDFKTEHIRFHNCKNFGLDEIKCMLREISRVPKLVKSLTQFEFFYEDIDLYKEEIAEYAAEYFEGAISISFKEENIKRNTIDLKDGKVVSDIESSGDTNNKDDEDSMEASYSDEPDIPANKTSLKKAVTKYMDSKSSSLHTPEEDDSY